MTRRLGFLLCFVLAVRAYKPVVLVHGILDDDKSMDDLKELIVDAHPGTDVTSIGLFNNADSLVNMWLQVAGFGDAIRDIMKANPDGIHLLCFSQGGLACRGVLQNTPNHNVETFVSLSSPQMGQFGDTMYVPYIPPVVLEDLYWLFYSPDGQMISVGNYWNGILYEENKSFVVLLKFLQYQVAQSVTSIDNFLRLVPDPFHQDVYLQKNIFLPLLNNQTYNPYSEGNKTGITRLKKLVAIGGPDDGVITPWQSSHFGFYKTGSDTEIVDTKDQETYLTDSIGLRTLDEHGDFIVYNINGVHHTHWHQNKTVFDCCIKQWLT